MDNPTADRDAERDEQWSSCRGRLAYLTGEYPRATDTFVQREVFALRGLGFDVLACAARQTDASHHVGPEQQAEAASAFYVIRHAKNPLRLIGSHLRVFFASPKRYAEGLALAFRLGWPGVQGRLFPVFYFAEAGVLADELRRRGVEHLHNHFANSSCTLAAVAAHLAGIPFSFTMHGPAIFFEPGKWKIGVKADRAAFVACISDFCRSQGMIFAPQRAWENMTIVHCGIEPERYTPKQHAERGTKLLFVARLAAVKGLPVLLDALVDLSSDVTLTVVGDGPDRETLEKQAASLGLAGRVDFVGYRSQDEVAQHLAEADLFVLPSFAEGVPVVLMEAMATGLPVVATRVAGVAELVEDGVSGALVPPGNRAELTDAIGRFVEDADRRQRFGEAGRAKVVAEFNTRTEAEKLAALFARSFAVSGASKEPPVVAPSALETPGVQRDEAHPTIDPTTPALRAAQGANA